MLPTTPAYQNRAPIKVTATLLLTHLRVNVTQEPEWESSMPGPKHGPLNKEDPDGSSGLLDSLWSSPSYCGHLRSESTEGRPLFPSVYGVFPKK